MGSKYVSLPVYGSRAYTKRLKGVAARHGVTLGEWVRYCLDVMNPSLREPDYKVEPETAEDAREKSRGASGEDELEGELETLSA